MKDGSIYIGTIETANNGETFNNYKGYFGLDASGAYLGFTNAYPSLSTRIDANGLRGNVTGKIINCQNNYCYAIGTAYNDKDAKYYISVIRGDKNNKLTIRGRWGTDNYNNLTFTLSTSDRRLKKNILPTSIDNALSQILKIKHRKFDWKLTNTHVDIGYVAQELEEINPRLVTKASEENGMYTVDTFYMTSLITKSIQEMYAELKAENTALKKRIQVLENQIL